MTCLCIYCNQIKNENDMVFSYGKAFNISKNDNYVTKIECISCHIRRMQI